MDNFTHSLTGWAIGQTGLKRKSRKGLAALVLGANMPDLDVFFGHSCWPPLSTHRGVTHSLVGGVVVMPLLLAALLWLWDRWQVRRGVEFRSGLAMHPGWLLALCYIGAVSHPLLDLQTSYAVQLLSPFSNLWFHTESLFIIDVWIWSALSLAIWLSRRRERAGGNWRAPPQIALAATLAYIVFNLVLTDYAKAKLQTSPPYPAPDALFGQFRPVTFWERGLVWREHGRVSYAAWSPFSGLRSISGPKPDNMADPLARRAMVATPAIRNFMRWSVMPMATIERSRCHAHVGFTDARFANFSVPFFKAESPFWHETILPLAGPGCPMAPR